MTLTKNVETEERVKTRYLKDFFVTKILKDNDLRDYLYLVIARVIEIDVEEVSKDFELCDIITVQ